MAGKLENVTLFPLCSFEDVPILIDIPYIEDMADVVLEQLHDLERRIYTIVGYQIKLGSSKQLGDALN